MFQKEPKITDEDYIRSRIYAEVITTGMALTKKNEKSIKKLIAPFIDKLDKKVVKKVLKEMLQ